MIPTNILETAIQLASGSLNKFRHAAVVYDDHARILGLALNDPYHNDIAKPYYPMGRLHAEYLALMRARLTKRSPGKIYMLVIRVNKNGVLRMSKPCIHCQRVISKYPISKVYYSTDNGIEEL